MKIRSIEYAGTVATPGGAPPGELPQVAFSGRSNVGKSSLINTLLRRTRSKMARVSSKPGKTRALNFYRVNDRFFLVDLPGFGYARVPENVRAEWKHLVESYLSATESLRGVVHLVDARRSPMETDLHMIEYLGSLGIPTLVVVTKIDKLPRRERATSVERLRSTLRVDAEQLVPFSARTGEGREHLLAALEVLLESPDDHAVQRGTMATAVEAGSTPEQPT